MNNYPLLYISICLMIIILSFLGIHFISKKVPWIIGECSYNEKSSIFHDKMLRGLGIIYPFSILPIFFLNNDIIELTDYLMLLSLTIIGFIDDKQGLNYKVKIVLFLFISFIYNIFIETGHEYSSYFKLILNIGLLCFLIIFFNQIDGINGLAVITFLILFVFTKILTNSIILYLPLILFSLPYLYYNLFGKIGIQGDSGSYFLAGIVFISLKNFDHFELNNLILIFFICPILLDIIATTIIKVFYRQNIFDGHKDNLYQKLASYTSSHLLSTGLFSFLQIIFCSITIFFFKNYSNYIFLFIISSIVLITFLCLLFVSFQIQRNKIFKSNSETKI